MSIFEQRPAAGRAVGGKYEFGLHIVVLSEMSLECMEMALGYSTSEALSYLYANLLLYNTLCCPVLPDIFKVCM